MLRQFRSVFGNLGLNWRERFAKRYSFDFGKSIFEEFFDKITSVDTHELEQIYYSSNHPSLKFWILQEYDQRFEHSDCDAITQLIFVNAYIHFLKTQVKYATPTILMTILKKWFPFLTEQQQLQVLPLLPTTEEQAQLLESLSSDQQATLLIIGGVRFSRGLLK